MIAVIVNDNDKNTDANDDATSYDKVVLCSSVELASVLVSAERGEGLASSSHRNPS